MASAAIVIQSKDGKREETSAKVSLDQIRNLKFIYLWDVLRGLEKATGKSLSREVLFSKEPIPHFTVLEL